MSAAGLESFDTTVQKTHMWLRDLMEELGWDDRHKAYHALRSVLHALRDRLTVDETVHLGAQLPMLVRGFYYDGWKPGGKRVRERHREQFLDHIEQAFRADDSISAEAVARAVFGLLARRVTAGEIEDVKRVLPPELRDLWPAS